MTDQPTTPTPREVADRFKEVLRRWLSPAELAAIDETNRRRADGPCATHDYCDANMAMLEALTRICPTRTEDDLCDELCMGQTELLANVNDGWTLAKIEGYYPHKGD